MRSQKDHKYKVRSLAIFVIDRVIGDRHNRCQTTSNSTKYPGIYGIDTRALTRKIRMFGAMNGGISTSILDEAELLEKVQAAPSMKGLNLVRQVTTQRFMNGQIPPQQLGNLTQLVSQILKNPSPLWLLTLA
jgi:carbamoylphosphate synthase small subunit